MRQARSMANVRFHISDQPSQVPGDGGGHRVMDPEGVIIQGNFGTTPPAMTLKNRRGQDDVFNRLHSQQSGGLIQGIDFGSETVKRGVSDLQDTAGHGGIILNNIDDIIIVHRALADGIQHLEDLEGQGRQSVQCFEFVKF